MTKIRIKNLLRSNSEVWVVQKRHFGIWLTSMRVSARYNGHHMDLYTKKYFTKEEAENFADTLVKANTPIEFKSKVIYKN